MEWSSSNYCSYKLPPNLFEISFGLFLLGRQISGKLMGPTPLKRNLHSSSPCAFAPPATLARPTAMPIPPLQRYRSVQLYTDHVHYVDGVKSWENLMGLREWEIPHQFNVTQLLSIQALSLKFCSTVCYILLFVCQLFNSARPATLHLLPTWFGLRPSLYFPACRNYLLRNQFLKRYQSVKPCTQNRWCGW